MPPLVHAIILNYNGASWLKRCLESLLSCSYPRFRVVLVDNGSTDNSIALARNISPQVEILAAEANLGFCAGGNLGIDHALAQGADYVALLNNDMYFEPDWLDRLVEVGEAQSQVGLLGPVQMKFDSQEFNTWMTTALPNVLDLVSHRDEPGAWVSVEWLEGSCLVIKRKVFEQIGRLDPIFFAFFEECDFCRRARAAGFQVGLVLASKIHHYRGGSYNQSHLARQRSFHITQSSMIYNSTDPEASAFANALRLFRNDATHLKEALVGKSELPIWWQANCSVFGRLPALYRKWRRDREKIREARAAGERPAPA